MKLRDDRRTAELSDDRVYRYRLRRTWDPRLDTVAFVMLNPSTADEAEDDPTIRRCKGFAEDWGFGSLLVANCYGLRTSEPDDLLDHPDPVGPENDEHLLAVAKAAAGTVAAWGAHEAAAERGPEVARLLAAEGVSLSALNTTQDGHPAHPLFQPGDATPEPFAYGGDA